MGAHQNNLECAPLFMLAVLACLFAQVDRGHLDAVSTFYAVIRFLYNGFYLYDKPVLRMCSFLASVAAISWLFILAASTFHAGGK